VCKELVQNEGIQSLILCPGFPHEAVAEIANAVGEEGERGFIIPKDEFKEFVEFSDEFGI
jgi:hypothetical protein